MRAVLQVGQPINVQCYVWLTGAEPLLIDEQRVRPERALMTTQTFIPGVGILTETDANDRTTYYEYDANHRLVLVKDDDGSIVKRLSYGSPLDDQEIEMNAYLAANSRQTPGQPNRFVAETYDCAAVEYLWNFGDGTSDTGTATPTHTYQQPGNYTVTVVATNDAKNPVEQVIPVVIHQPPTASIFHVSGDLNGDMCAHPGPDEAVLGVTNSRGCGGPYSYTWQKKQLSPTLGNWVYAGSHNPTLTVWHSTVNATEYRCQVTDRCGNMVTSSTMIVRTQRSNTPCMH